MVCLAEMRQGWVLLLVSACLSKPGPPDQRVPDGGAAIDAVAADCVTGVIPGFDHVMWSHPQLLSDELRLYGWADTTLYVNTRTTTADQFVEKSPVSGFAGPLCWLSTDGEKGLVCEPPTAGVHQAAMTGTPMVLAAQVVSEAITATAAPGTSFPPQILYVDSNHQLFRYTSGQIATLVGGPPIDSITLGLDNRVVFRATNMDQMQVATLTDHGLQDITSFAGAPGPDDNHPAFTADGRSIVFDRKNADSYAIMEATCW